MLYCHNCWIMPVTFPFYVTLNSASFFHWEECSKYPGANPLKSCRCLFPFRVNKSHLLKFSSHFSQSARAIKYFISALEWVYLICEEESQWRSLHRGICQWERDRSNCTEQGHRTNEPCLFRAQLVLTALTKLGEEMIYIQQWLCLVNFVCVWSCCSWYMVEIGQLFNNVYYTYWDGWFVTGILARLGQGWIGFSAVCECPALFKAVITLYLTLLGNFSEFW